MSDDTRRRVTDPLRVAAFGEAAREAAAKDLRELDPAITDEEIEAMLGRAGAPFVVHATARITTGIATTPEELAALRRRLPGAANQGGRRSRRMARIEAIEEAADKLGDAATRLRVAQSLGMVDAVTRSEETGQCKADVRAAGGWDDGIMERVRSRRKLALCRPPHRVGA